MFLVHSWHSKLLLNVCINLSYILLRLKLHIFCILKIFMKISITDGDNHVNAKDIDDKTDDLERNNKDNTINSDSVSTVRVTLSMSASETNVEFHFVIMIPRRHFSYALVNTGK